MAWVKNHVLLLLLAMGAAAASGLAFLTHAPNRLVSGVSISLAEALMGGDGAWRVCSLLSIVLPAVLLGAAIFMRGSWASRLMVIMAAALLLAGLAYLAGAEAKRLASADLASSIERTSLGGAFWVLSALAWLAAGDAIAHLGLRPVWRLAAGAAVIAPVLACMATGLLDQLSLLKEYANRADLFNAALLQHVQIVLASLLPSLLIGVPL
ncbi:MAG: ABC transporter permease, partial [Polaromonas sp.]